MPLQMRLPKFGFSSRVGRKTAQIRTSELAKLSGTDVNIQALRDAHLITAEITRAKIMLSGDVSRAYTVTGIGVTKGARAAIEAAGGKVEEIVEEKRGKLVKKDKPAAKESAKSE